MPDYISELLFWIAIFVGLFFALRWLQARKLRNDAKNKDTE